MKTHISLFSIAVLLSITNSASAQTWIQVDKVVASDRTWGDELGYSVDVDGYLSVAGAHLDRTDANDQNPLYRAGSAYFQQWNGSGNWIETQKVVASDRDSNDYFGCSVSISGNYAIIGAILQDKDENGNSSPFLNSGAAYIFERNQLGTWTEVQKLVAPDRDTGDNFGHSVSIHGDYAVVGAYFEDEDAGYTNQIESAGSVYIYKRNSLTGNWDFSQKIVAADRSAYDYFGWAVAILGNRLVVSAVLDNEDANNQNTLNYSGSAYVFELQTNGVWQQVAKIVASDRADYDNFGQSVTLSNSAVFIGANNESEDENGGNTMSMAGSVYIFRPDAMGNWVQIQKIVPADRTDHDSFGFSLDANDSILVVSAIGNSTDENGNNLLADAGAVYVFSNASSGIWIQRNKIVASDRSIWASFGFSLAISGNTIMTGVPSDSYDENGNNQLQAAGSVYYFEDSSNTTGIQSRPDFANFSVYPNPTSGYLVVSIENAGEILVYDNLGNLVKTQEGLPGENRVDLTNLSPGLYLVEFRQRESVSAIRVLIK